MVDLPPELSKLSEPGNREQLIFSTYPNTEQGSPSKRFPGFLSCKVTVKVTVEADCAYDTNSVQS